MRTFAAILISTAVLVAGCEDREPKYEDAGERYDAAIKRVEDAKEELRAAEAELAEARRAIEEKVQQGPETADEVVPEEPN